MNTAAWAEHNRRAGGGGGAGSVSSPTDNKKFNEVVRRPRKERVSDTRVETLEPAFKTIFPAQLLLSNGFLLSVVWSMRALYQLHVHVTVRTYMYTSMHYVMSSGSRETEVGR